MKDERPPLPAMASGNDDDFYDLPVSDSRAFKEQTKVIDKEYITSMLAHMDLSNDEMELCADFVQDASGDEAITGRIDELILQAGQKVLNERES